MNLLFTFKTERYLCRCPIRKKTLSIQQYYWKESKYLSRECFYFFSGIYFTELLFLLIIFIAEYSMKISDSFLLLKISYSLLIYV